MQSSYLLNASLTVHGFDFSPLDDYRIRDSTIVGAQVGSYLHTHTRRQLAMATVSPSPSYLTAPSLHRALELTRFLGLAVPVPV